MKLASFKIQILEEHVRAVVADYDGAGFDLRGRAAREVIEAATPVVAWLWDREPGVKVRSMSFNDARVLVSVESAPRPRALRFDPPHSEELRAAAGDAERTIERHVTELLERRRALPPRSRA